jgi:hypothetical protein
MHRSTQKPKKPQPIEYPLRPRVSRFRRGEIEREFREAKRLGKPTRVPRGVR